MRPSADSFETINPLQRDSTASDELSPQQTRPQPAVQTATVQTATAIQLVPIHVSRPWSATRAAADEGANGNSREDDDDTQAGPGLPLDSLRRFVALRRNVVAVGRTSQPGICVGNTTYSIFLLCMALLIEVAIFTLHCTSALDTMVDEPDARGWVGVTPQIAVLAGVLLVPAMLEALVSLGQLTCCWRRAVQRERRKAGHIPWRRVSESQSTFRALWRGFNYLRKPTSAHYMQLLFLLEAKEFVFQSLALELMSRSGIGPQALTLFTTVVLLNGLTPLGMRWIVDRINRIDDPVRRRKEASKWLARQLLFDATCDLLYSFFGLVHMLFRYVRLFHGADTNSAELEAVHHYAATSVQPVVDLKAYMILSEAKAALFGADSGFFDVFVKIVARGVPLLQVPFRVMAAFAIRQSMSAGDDHEAVAEANAAQVAAAKTIELALEGKSSSSTTTTSSSKTDLRAHSIPPHASSIIKRRMVMLVKRRAFTGRYDIVPRWAAGSLFVAVLGVCLTVYVRLSRWGECQVPEIRRSCAVRAFPVFHAYGNTDDFECRSCACNTLFYVNDNCTTLATVRNNSTSKALPSHGCRAAGGLRYASEALNASAVILQPAATILVQACPSDAGFLRTIGARAQTPSVLQIFGALEERAQEKAANAAAWTFPPRFGYRPGQDNGDEVWPLSIFYIQGYDDHMAYGDGQRMDLESSGMISLSLLGDLPSALEKMTTLKGLQLSRLALTQVPPITKLADLRQLILYDNRISSVPSSLGTLTGGSKLMYLYLKGNPISKFPSSLGRLSELKDFNGGNTHISSVPAFLSHLTSLTRLTLHHCAISFVPTFIGKLTGLRYLIFENNLITSMPFFIGQLTGMVELNLGSNTISTIPASFGRLTNLKYLTLDNNTLTTIPESVLTMARSPSTSNLRLSLEANNISRAAATAMVSAISAVSSNSASDPASSLMLLGRNAACDSSSLISRVGPWQISCRPECALRCQETLIGEEIKSRLGNGRCDFHCNTAACGWDGGDCLV